MESHYKMNKFVLSIVVALSIVFFIVVVIFDIVPPMFWSVIEFSNPSYHSILEKEWLCKSSDFLLLKLHSIDPMRFGLAAYILGKRKEQRAVRVLSRIARSAYVDNQIHFSAASALAQISPPVAKKILYEVIERYQSVKGDKSSADNKYNNALRILASLKDERVYSIILQMAKSGDRVEREFALDGALYYFDNHSEESLPLYVSYLNSKESYKGQVINEIKKLKRPEAIPALEEFALKNASYEKEARDAIEYLKGLQE